MEQDIIFGVIGVAASAGAAAWTAVKLSLNGMRGTVRRIEAKLDRIEAQAQDNRMAIGQVKSVCRLRHGIEWE